MNKCINRFGLCQPAKYQIEVVGHLNKQKATWFRNLNLANKYDDDGTPITVIAGEVCDQAALHGLLGKIRDLGLPLLAVNRIQSNEPYSIKHSSTNTKLDFFFAAEIIFVNCVFEIIVPVGLFGLQTKTHPFLGIFEINESISSERFIVLKKVNLQSTSFAADSYSLKVGIGIKTRFFDKNAVQKL